MQSNNIYMVVRHSLEDIENRKGAISVQDAMYILYRAIDTIKEVLGDTLRNQAAIAAMQGFISMLNNPEIVESVHLDACKKGMTLDSWVADTSILYADALLKRLKR